MSNSIAGLALPDFVQAAQALLPRGRAWPRDAEYQLTGLVTAMVGRMAAAHAASADLSEVESDPRQTNQLLPDWEASFGLPDPCTPANPSIQQRRAALVARIASQGGQSPAYYIQVAASLGYSITITEFATAQFGVTGFGGAFYSDAWANAWQVNAPSMTIQYAAFGASVFGDPFATFNSTQLGCVLERIKPAHTDLILNFGA